MDFTRKGLHRLDMKEKGAPEIKRYLECNYPEGYIYVILLNNDPASTYKEVLQFEKFEKLQMLKPHSG